MAQLIKIGALAYHNFQKVDDNIKIRYDKTKSDQAGEKVRDKYVYANPFIPLCCPILALGVCFSLELTRLGIDTRFSVCSNIEEEASSNR